ncbi:hypothetical protein VTI74DRAFT_77 [Chaetomium olivicolor]
MGVSTTLAGQSSYGRPRSDNQVDRLPTGSCAVENLCQVTRQDSDSLGRRQTATANVRDDAREINSIALINDSAHFISGSRDGCVTFWDVPSDEPLAVLRIGDSPIEAINVGLVRTTGFGNTTSHILATATADQAVRLWKLAGRPLTAQLDENKQRHTNRTPRGQGQTRNWGGLWGQNRARSRRC